MHYDAMGKPLEANEKPGVAAGLHQELLSRMTLRQAPRAFTRCARRDTFREAVFLCRTPFVAARISSG